MSQHIKAIRLLSTAVFLFSASFLTALSQDARAQSWTRIPGLPIEQFVSLTRIDGTLHAVGERRVYRNDNRGNTWTDFGIVHPDILALSVITQFDGNLYVGTYKSGVWRSSDEGATWSAANEGFSGLGASDILCFAVRGDSLYAGTGGAGVFVRRAGDASWTPFNDGLSSNNSYTVYTLEVSNGTMIATAGGNGGVFRRPQGAAKWLDAPLPGAPIPGLELVDLHRDGSRLLVAGTRRVFLSDDEAQTWTECPTPFPAAFDVRLTTLGSRVYALVNTLHEGTLTFHSDDHGQTWQQGETIGFSYAADLLTVDGQLYAACEDGVRTFDPQPTSLPGIDRTIALSIDGVTPHPLKESGTVTFSIERASTAALTLIDATGRVHVLMPSRPVQAGIHHVQWNAHDLAPGMYTCSLQAGGGLATRTFLLVR
ncbi:MAG: hypothetical protein HY962_00455 [Ignavibacteriae bacterium]|nr:hypothetical protein [Ignavibacteriota bacterium]